MGNLKKNLVFSILMAHSLDLNDKKSRICLDLIKVFFYLMNPVFFKIYFQIPPESALVFYSILTH